MKYYAMFYNKNPITGQLYQPCGDRATIQLDGRLASHNMYAVAADTAKRRGFIGYHIEKGDCLLTARPITKIISVEHMSDLETVSKLINGRNAK